MLLHLPPELLILILSELSSNDILFSAQLVNRRLHDLIRDSSLLQYHVETKYAGVEDNPQSTMVAVERLEALRRSEYAWAHFIVGKRVKLPVWHRSSGLYDLTAGVYVLGEYGEGNEQYPTPALRFTYLSEDQGNKPWGRISANSHIIDFGLGVREHDLVALVTTRPKGNMSGTNVTELVLLSISTGEHHPSTAQPVIYLTETTTGQGHCSIMLEIVGDNLALLLTYRQHLGLRVAPDTFHVYNWRTGALTATLPESHHAYQGFIFLTETSLLLPNLEEKRLEIYTLSSTGLTPQCFLDLPALSPQHTIWMLTCRAEPNPIGEHSSINGIYARDSANPPFVSSPADAIALFNMSVIGHPADFSYFSFIVHRSALLKFVPAHPHTYSPYTSTIESRIGMSHRIEVSISPACIPWNRWGPLITRCFSARGIAHGYITTTAGQRSVCIPTQAENDPSPITVRDFNPYNIARYTEPETDSIGGYRRLVTDPTLLEPRHVFTEDVWSALPYIEVVSRQRYDYTAVLMDEERILGLRLHSDFFETAREVDVLHMQ
jgi:hypothetical protein